MTKLAFNPEHLTTEEKREQARKCVNMLEDQTERMTEWEAAFYQSMQEQADYHIAWEPSYRQLNKLKDLVEKYA